MSNPDTRPLPDGWIQQFNDEHKTWFYVNKNSAGGAKSQWTHPADDQPSYAPPAGPPPSQGQGQGQSNEKRDYSSPTSPQGRYQDQGSANSYYNSSANNGNNNNNSSQQPPYSPATQEKRGLGGLLSKLSGKMGNSNQPGQYGQQSYGGGYQQGPPQGYGYQQQGYPQQGYGGQGMMMGGGYGGGYAQQPMYAQQPPRRQGMGAGTGAALGLGGGLLGGMLISDMMMDNQQDAYQDGYQDGAMDDGGGDMGGGDF